jgi:uncharacterized protein (DUF433 family)
MAEVMTQQPTIVRNDMGLTIKGTRLTLYHVMEDLKGGVSAETIKDWYSLTDEEYCDVLQYLETHRDEVEAEYQEVLEYAEKTRQYWEERNREHFARIAAMPPKPGQEEIRAKLQAWKAKLAAERSLS